MKITSVTPMVSKNHFGAIKKSQPKSLNTSYSEINLNNLPNYALINFGHSRKKVQNGDLTPYEIAGRMNPHAEISKEEHRKFKLSVAAEEFIEEENYLQALKTKIEIASICQTLGQTRDAYLLETTIRELYAALPKYQKEEAREAISHYNFDMARYIDKDTENM